MQLGALFAGFEVAIEKLPDGAQAPVKRLPGQIVVFRGNRLFPAATR
jgi:hypothetical protein